MYYDKLDYLMVVIIILRLYKISIPSKKFQSYEDSVSSVKLLDQKWINGTVFHCSRDLNYHFFLLINMKCKKDLSALIMQFSNLIMQC